MGQPWLVFNLNDDPYEQSNLAHNTKFRAERRRLVNMAGDCVVTLGPEGGRGRR